MPASDLPPIPLAPPVPPPAPGAAPAVPAGAGSGPAATVPAVPAGAPITDFRTQSYPFSVTSRFQEGGFSDLRSTRRASQGLRLTWGVLAALGAVLFVASVIILLQVLDRSMHG